MKLEELRRYFAEHTVHAPLQLIEEPLLAKHSVALYLKREDLIHPQVSGNKWRKLKYNLLRARAEGHDALLTFGGAYSNHILATAAAGELFNFRTIGVIRGEAYSPLNPVLARARAHGMVLEYLPRWAYRRRDEPAIIEPLARRHGPAYRIPEGGSNPLGVRGCREIVGEINVHVDVISCACGSGGTLAGLISGIGAHQRALGIAVLKGAGYLEQCVEEFLPRAQRSRPNWSICHDYHFNGYAKNNEQLTNFIRRFRAEHGICLDAVYTGKMMYGLFDLIRRGCFSPGTTLVALHTGNYPDK
jgi:1-aminocyclopropane-1-carboxylate deaminase